MLLNLVYIFFSLYQNETEGMQHLWATYNMVQKLMNHRQWNSG